MPDLPLIDIGNTDENADWILTEERRQEEIAIHEALEARRKKASGFEWELEVKGVPAEASKGGPGSGNWRHTGLAGVHGGADAGGGVGEVASWNDQQYKEANSELTAWYADWRAGLSQDQWDGIDWYTGSGYGVVNAELRGEKSYAGSEQMSEAKKYAPELDRAIDRTRLPFSAMVHRGMCSDTVSDCYRRYSSLEPGDEFSDKGFVSTSVIAEEARPWSGIVCHITLPKGSKAAYVENISGIGELEMLLPRGSRFRVVGKRQEGTTIPRLHLELVLMAPEDPPPLPWGETAEKQKREPAPGDQPEKSKFLWKLGDITIFKKGEKGGPGSGHWQHEGRPGLVGGSSPGGGIGDVWGGYEDKRNIWPGEWDKQLQHAIHRGEQLSKDWREGLSIEEQIALKKYTSYQMDMKANGYLRTGGAHLHDKKLRAKVEYAIEQLDSALDKAEMPHSVEVRRSLCSSKSCMEKFAALEPGDMFEALGYSSTMLVPGAFGRKGINVNITIPKGAKAAYLDEHLTNHPEETEVLIPRGSRFRVTGSSVVDRGLVSEEWYLDVVLMSSGEKAMPAARQAVKAKGEDEDIPADRMRRFHWEGDDVKIIKRAGKKASGFGWELEVQVPAEASEGVPAEASKGGPGSGHWQHEGRPGLVGGSAPGGGIGEVRRITGTPYQLNQVGDKLGYGPSTRWGKNLSKAEKKAIFDYTQAGFLAMNCVARLNCDDKNMFETPLEQHKARGNMPHLDKALAKGRLEESIRVHRGMCRSLECAARTAKLEVGDEFLDHGYVSTSLEASRAEDRRIKFRITIPKGSPGAYVGRHSAHEGEAEFLLPRDTKFRITGKRNVGATTIFEATVMSYGEDGPPIMPTTETQKAIGQKESSPEPDRDRYFTWEEGDIEIIKGGKSVTPKTPSGFVWDLEVIAPEEASKGGPGSGHWQHEGRPGLVGGSAPGGGIGQIEPIGSWTSVDVAHMVGDKVGYSMTGPWQKSLTGDERSAIYHYTDTSWMAMNCIMRANCDEDNLYEGASHQAEAYKRMPHLDRALAKGKLEKSITVHRGLCGSDECVKRLGQLEVGDEFQDHGYSSTSLRQSGEATKLINVNITIPKGSPGAYVGRLSSHKGENEFLLPRGAKFRITGKSVSYALTTFDVVLMSYGKDGPPIMPDLNEFFVEDKAMTKAKRPRPDRERYFTWEEGDIEIIKKGGKTTEASKASPWDWKLELVPGSDVKGGAGSGHHGHAGRPGKRGGSAPGKAGGGAGGGTEAAASGGGKSPKAVAKSIIDLAKKHEPGITKTVTETVKELGGQMAGLQFRIKGEDSLTRKINGYVEEKGVPPTEAGGLVKDAVRYTAIFDANSYAGGSKEVQRALEQRGWKRYDHQFKNYWRAGDDYDGYNCVFVNDEGFKFELQFHTPESIRVKAKSHVFYEESRELPPGPKRDSLINQMKSLWGSVARPVGWEALPGVLK